MQKLLIILEAGKAYPSGIIRGLIYKDLFAKKAYVCKYVSRLPPFLIKLMDKSGRILKTFPFLRQTLLNQINKFTISNREKIISLAPDFDVVFMSKVFDYNLISNLKRIKKRLILDFGDSVWLYNNGNNDFYECIDIVDAVITDNEYTASYVRKYNANCFVIPDYPQLDKFEKKRNKYKNKSGNIIIGWIGSQSSFKNLLLIWDVLESVFTKYSNLHLKLLGAPVDLPKSENIKYTFKSTYTQSEMIKEVLSMDIGLFPLDNTVSSQVRGILKATIYMCGEVAVICSPIGQLKDFIIEGHNGLFANDKNEWEQKLELLILNKCLRKKIAKQGLEHVRDEFSIEENFKKLCAILE
jgi:glycosyltransferase involved in cell wall biosynthesis